MRPARILGSLLLAAALAPVAGTAPAAAVTFTVDSTADLPDANLGDGTCAAAGGLCTLRAAAEQAEALGGEHTIVVPAGSYSLGTPIVLDTPGLDLTIVGATGAAEHVTLTAAGDRHLTVSDGQVTLEAVRLIGGLGTNHGGAIAISGTGSVRLERAHLDGNEATAFGGAVSVTGDGSLVAVESTLASNEAGQEGGAIWADDDGAVTLIDTAIVGNEAGTAGGGLHLATGVARIEGGTIMANQAGNRGGGIAADGTDLEVVGTTVTDNRGAGLMAAGGIHVESDLGAFRLVVESATVAGNDGAGIRAYAAGSPSSSLVVRSTVVDGNDEVGIFAVGTDDVEVAATRSTGNRVGAVLAGGLVEGSLFDANRDMGLYIGGRITVRNSTISGNFGNGSFAGGSLGGGVVALGDDEDDVQVLEHVTITGNQVGLPPQGAGFTPPGGLLAAGGTIELRSTIVAGNEGPQCTVTDALGSTTWTSGGTNLFGDDACPAVASDLVAADPLLGELGSAGGAVPGHLPDLASPAVDAAQDAWCPAVDQVGTARPQAAAGGGCDIGAIERLATPTGSGPGDPAGPGSPGGPGTGPVAPQPAPPATPVRGTARYTG